MTVHGELVPLSFNGMGRQSVGFMTKATYEQAMTSLQSGALSHSKEKVESVSASITVGQLPKIGTGSVQISIDRRKIIDQLDNIDDLVIDENAFAQMYSNFESQDVNDVTMDIGFDDADLDNDTTFGEEISDTMRFHDLSISDSTNITKNLPPMHSSYGNPNLPNMAVGSELSSALSNSCLIDPTPRSNLPPQSVTVRNTSGHIYSTGPLANIPPS